MNGELIAEGEVYHPWPNFRVDPINRFDGIMHCDVLWGILVSRDEECVAWRERIPPAVLKIVFSYQDKHAELLMLAESDEEGFIELFKRNAALLYVVASIRFHLIQGGWTLKESDVKALQLGYLKGPPKAILELLGLPQERGIARIFGRLRPSDCHMHGLELLNESCENKLQLAILRHLPGINLIALWIMARSPVDVYDVPLLRLAAAEPIRGERSILDIVHEIMRVRSLMGLSPWPYRGYVRDWERLIKVERRTAEKYLKSIGPFPESPVPTDKEHVPPEIVIQPVSTVSGLLTERALAGLTPVGAERVIEDDAYLYRLLWPERASVILKNTDFGWQMGEVIYHKEPKMARGEVEVLLEQWLMMNGFSWKEMPQQGFLD